jgi:uncharacterized protein (TIGR00290 family)
MPRIKAVISWSGGKDSLMALWKLPADYEVVALLTNLNQQTNRVSIHGVRRALIEAQAAAIGLPVHFVMLPTNPTNVEYEALVQNALAPFQAQGIQHVVYGDLFLEDIRHYRDAFCQRLGMQPVYPVWGLDTKSLITEFIEAKFRAIISCVDTTQIAMDFVGRELDHKLLHELPKSADPCGENGEFHTFAYDGPLFRQPVKFTFGETWLQDKRFFYRDMM